jgi:hypothetical protein
MLVLGGTLAVLLDPVAAQWARQQAHRLIGRVSAPALTSAYHPPTPTPTPPPTRTTNRFYWLHAVPWGSLSVDGQPGPDLNRITIPPGATPPVPSFTLAPGRHTLDYHADHLPTLHCIVSVPAATSDTCPLAQPAPGDLETTSDGSRILDLGAVPDQLDPPQFIGLLTAIQGALSAPTATITLAKGDHLLTANGSIATASESLTAGVRYTINQEATPNAPGTLVTCVTLCVTTGVIAAQADGSWHVAAHVVVSWQYASSAGAQPLTPRLPAAGTPGATTPITTTPAPTSTPARYDSHLLVPIEAQWQGDRWEVQVPVLGVQGDSLPCEVAHHQRDRVIQSSPAAARWQNTAWGTVPAADPAQGCLLIGGKPSVANPDQTASVPLLFYRCGALVAANTAAQQAFPALPVASSGEETLARQLIPPGLVGAVAG